MRLLIIQPKLEDKLVQLEKELKNNPSVDGVVFPEGYLNENIEQACLMAKNYNKVLIGGYRRLKETPKDRAVLIDRTGDIVIDRAKYSPTVFETVEGLKIGHILCDELVKQGVKNKDSLHVDLIVHPIGVGMFSEEQFNEWIEEAKKLAVTYKTMILGTSHADGSYRGSEVSIPIAYCIDKGGAEVFISKKDTRSRIIDVQTQHFQAL